MKRNWMYGPLFDGMTDQERMLCLQDLRAKEKSYRKRNCWWMSTPMKHARCFSSNRLLFWILSYLQMVSLQERSLSFVIPFDRRQLAADLNLERTSLSKELSHMQKDGLICCHKRHFTLLQASKEQG